MESRITLQAIGAVCVWVSVPAVLGAQLIIWLKSGSWPAWTFGDGWALIGVARPVTEWSDIQQICDWVWSWPLCLGVFVSVAILAALIPGVRRP